MLIGNSWRNARHSLSRSHSSGIALGGRPGHVAGDDLVDHLADLLVQVGAFQHLAPLGVDDLALPVQHVVVLQDVLADLEVLLLDLGLRGADGAGDDLGFDRHVRRDVEPVHDRADPLGVEQPHQVVFQRQVEPALARVALAAGAAAQLVVDAARLVPLGAEHVQAARLDDLLVLLGHVPLGLGHRLGPGRLVVLGRLDRGQAALVQLRVGDELRVAAEHDVGAAAGHVGGHGDRAAAPGLGHDQGLPLVVLGVQHLVRDPCRLSIRDTISDFSTLVVPTRTGWPSRAARRCPPRRPRTWPAAVL